MPASNTPLVSIVIATYNGAKFLREQLDSLFAQTYAPLEIIAVDDCSSDSTLVILKEYELLHPNFKVYENEINCGPSKTFERGIKLCSGGFISLCDQDDVWAENKVSVLMNSWKENTVIIYCDSIFINSEGKSLGRRISDIKNLATYTNPLPFIIGNTVSGHAAIFTKKLATKAMPFPTFIIHDWWLAFVASTQGVIQFVDQPLVKYRQHTGNVIGAIKIKGRKKDEDKINKLTIIRNRISLFYVTCPDSVEAKKVLRSLTKSYTNFSLSTNFLRMITFLKFKDELLATKKRSPFRKVLFCVKMFFTLI